MNRHQQRRGGLTEPRCFTANNNRNLQQSTASIPAAKSLLYRSFHASPRQLEDAAAAAVADDNNSNNAGDDAAAVADDDADAGDDDTTPHPTEIEYAFTPPPPLSEDSIQKVNGLFEQILQLDMLEVHLLTMVVNEELGIKWNQVQAAGAGPIGGGSAAAAPAEEPGQEKLLKDLKLVGFDAKAKIKVIKEVRAIAGLGLKEAKELVESAPKIIQKELKPEKAEELKAQLEAVGAQIEIS
jgi:ribosomal protein L7/L12